MFAPAKISDTKSVTRGRLGFSITGEKNFQTYFSLDTVRSGLFKGDSIYLQYDSTGSFRILSYKHYWVRYNFHLASQKWSQYTFSWPLDSLGNIVKQYSPAGIPNCNSDTSSCSYVDSSQAISIAIKEGISIGVKPIYAELEFSIYSKGNVVWHVVSTIKKTQWHSTEEIYLIDLLTGKFIKKFQIEGMV